MKFNELVEILENNELPLQMVLPNGENIPNHFHVTEVGKVHKKLIDCGGTVRELTSCMLQVWTAHDVEHRLTSGKLVKILKLAKDKLWADEDLDVEIEYGEAVASQFTVSIEITDTNMIFVLAGKQTDCLAPDKCGINNCCC